MSDELFAEYQDAGCFDFESAVSLYELGIFPNDASVWTPAHFGIGEYTQTLGYKFANGDISKTEASAFARGDWVQMIQRRKLF